MNVVCIPVSDIQQEGVKQGVKRCLESLEEACKKLKPEVSEGELMEIRTLFEPMSDTSEDIAMDFSEMSEGRSTNPMELSKVYNIVHQFSLCATKMGLSVFTNKSSITTNYSKYH